MASKELKNIFLSASIPFKERDKRYYNTADVIAVRDAVIALATLVLPRYRLIWGGHPSITPIIYYVLDKFDVDIQNHIKLYQSLYYERIFPIENKGFENLVLTDDMGDISKSLELMRKKMLGDNIYEAAIFIGGMEGVEDEYEMFVELNPNAIILPIASTGGASKIIYENKLNDKNERLLNEYGYMSLFQELLLDRI